MVNKAVYGARSRTVTEYEFIQSMPPSKLATYLRRKLACNQGCPPAPLAHVFAMCNRNQSCDECWWTWLCSEHLDAKSRVCVDPDPDRKRCWDCRWGARIDNAHPAIACMFKKFYGVIMDADDYCSFYDERPEDPNIDKDAEAIAAKLGELCEENKEQVAEEIRKRYELKQLNREKIRRAKTHE